MASALTPKTLTTPDSEYALVGAALAHPEGLTELLGLDELDLGNPGCRTVYRAVKRLAASGDPVTPATVATSLERAGELEDVGGSTFVANLFEYADVQGASRWHAGKIREVASLRRLRDAGHIAMELAAQPDADPERIKADLIARVLDGTGRELDELIRTPAQGIEAMQQQALLEAEGSAITWGIEELDDVLPLLPGMLVYVAARPKTFKSSLLFQLATRNAGGGPSRVRVGVANYEMSQVQFAQHVLAKVGDVTMSEAKHGPYEGRWADAAEDAGRLDLTEFYHRPDMPTLAAQLTAAHRVRPFGLLCVDYIGKVAQRTAQGRGAFDAFQAVVAACSGALKELAVHLEVPVVSSAQINRAGADEPELHHLRDSGALEADADAVVLLHRPDPDEDPTRIDVKVAANRMGEPTGWLELESVGARGLLRSPAWRRRQLQSA